MSKPTRRLSRHSSLATRHFFLVLACGVLLLARSAFALDPSLDLSQFAHTAWKVHDGFTKGGIFAIAQTPDGYLWLGTEAGLYRFDGIRAVPWQPPGGEQLVKNRVQSLLVSRDNTLWISTIKGLASWKDSKFTQYPELAGQLLDALLQDRQGTVWVGAYQPGRICAIQGGKVQCFGADQFGAGVSGLYEDHNGNLWVCSSTGLWRWDFSHPDHYAFPGLEINRAIENESGELLLVTSDGLKQFGGGAIQNHPLAGITGKFRPSRFFRARDGSLWISTHQGLLRLHNTRTDIFGVAEGLSGNVTTCFFEDLEGNVWVGTTDGLDRFREYAIPSISTSEGLFSSYVYSVQTTSDGATWLGTSNELNRWKDGHVTVYGRPTQPGQIGKTQAKRSDGGLAGTPLGLGIDDQGRLLASTRDGIFSFEGDRFVRVPGAPGGNIWSIVGDGGGKLWVSDGTLGLFHFVPCEKVEPIPWSRFGQKGFGARALLPDRSQGGVWLGFWGGGIAYFKDGQVRASFTTADGLGNGRVDDLRFGPRGAMWAATEIGLSRIKNGHIATLTSKNGLPCDAVHWTMEDADHSMWLYMSCGLVRIARSEMDAWVSDPSRKLQLTIFDEFDGVRGTSIYGSIGPHVAKAADGKIWFATGDGVSVIDPRHIPFNKLPPPVHIEQITANHKTYDPAPYGNGHVSLPARTRDLEIDYTALSMVIPEKNRFRVKLEGYDRDWQDVGNRRQAFYTNLAARNYRFLVKACNNSGVWNERGAALDFTILPAYYQTNWFRAVCVGAFLALLWALYQLRLHQLRQRFNAGLEARVNERTRIARELHDTLLQSLHGLMFQFQAARNMLPQRPAEAADVLDSAIGATEETITDSRSAIQHLRSEPMYEGDLGQWLTATSQELARSPKTNGETPVFQLTVEGEGKALTPLPRDEIYRITREILRNAFQHAQASRIEAEIRYDDRELRVRIRDDGKGIDPRVLHEGGTAGHWGLRGVRERAQQIGARLDFWSEAGAGTEVELTVPAAIAYEKAKERRRLRLFSKV